ncbi:MAG: LysM peptidoglycan-binding domain-containing protein [Anaerolineae bacterium]|jgi:LysM repeat protein
MMKKGILVVLICTLLLLATAQAAAASGQIIHVVRYGENLYRIAQRYGTSVQAITSANGIHNPHHIYAGQRLIIPHGYSGGSYHGGGSYGGGYYVVRWGDTLSGIAYRHGVSLYALMQANGIHNPHCIYAGQKLVIPGWSGGGGGGHGHGKGGSWYTVRWGDTLAGIARYYGVNMWTIASANNLANPNCIYAGQRLYIP